jgi:4-amino-4-deoxy-L-arabinose transferase-like glycosyltransferase
MAAAPGIAYTSIAASKTPLWRHWLILIVGTLLVSACAFHGNIWFDESYSIALSSKSWADIWRIGATDVHPVLYYWALHCIYLVFGQNILAFRLFSLLGIVCVAFLGLTHIRRDAGGRAGELFSFLVLFTPYFANLAVQIRMYSWVIFLVTLCFIYGCRIMRSVWRQSDDARPNADLQRGDARRGDGRDSGLRKSSAFTWAIFFASSLASAYTHYYGAMSAFLINVIVLIALVVSMRSRRRMGDEAGRRLAKNKLICLLLGAAAQVALYLPWIMAMRSQVTSISGGNYWIAFDEESLFKLPLYQLLTDSVLGRILGKYYDFPFAARVALLAFALLIVIAFTLGAVSGIRAYLSARKSGALGADKAGESEIFVWRVCALGCIIYLGVICIALVCSLVIGTVIVYYRYLAVTFGVLLVSLAIALSRARTRGYVRVACAMLAVYFVLCQALTAYDYYSPINQEPYDYMEHLANDSSDGEQLPVLTNSISIGGVASLIDESLDVTFAGWSGGYWGAAYEAYQPQLRYASDLQESGIDTSQAGSMFVFATDQDRIDTINLDSIEQATNSTVVEHMTYFRPYDQHLVMIALMQVNEATESTDEATSDASAGETGEETTGESASEVTTGEPAAESTADEAPASETSGEVAAESGNSGG